MSKSLGTAFIAAGILAFANPSWGDENSGYLGDGYAKLEDAKSPSGAKVKRWVAPGFVAGKYDSIMLDNTIFYPEARETDQVSLATLEAIRTYLDEALKRELSGVIHVVDKPGPRTLRFKPAITAAAAGNVGLKPYQLIPAAFVFTMAKRATGNAAQEATLSVEYQVLDAQSNALVGAGMRQGTERMAKPADGLTLEAVKPVIDSWAKDARMFFQTGQ